MKAELAKKLIEEDQEYLALIHLANQVMIDRMDYNDHGIMHARIVAENALRIFDLLGEESNIEKEGIGDKEDAKVAILLASYLHDIGCCINRKDHELLGLILAKSIASRILERIYPNEVWKRSKMLAVILECILCHMGNYKPTSLEASIVLVADGTDMCKGRARIPFKKGKRDIHEYSAMAINKVEITKGKEKPVQIYIEMENEAGIFQVEEILLKKLEASLIRDKVEVLVNLKGKLTYY